MAPSSASPRATPMLLAAAPTTSTGPSLAQDSVGSPFNSSMGLTILILLGALFFMGFFSIYIRRFAATDDSDSELIIPTAHRRRLRVLMPVSMSGLDPTIIRALPCYAYVGSDFDKYQAECPVCLSEFMEGEAVKAIPRCHHVFHAQCIDRWLGSHSTCPVCRATQLVEVVGTSYVEASETATSPTASDVSAVGAMMMSSSCSELEGISSGRGPTPMYKRTLSV